MTDFETAYCQTSYVVDDGPVKFTIRLDGGNESLYEFLAETNATTWAFLTAYNPLGLELPASENKIRQAELIEILERAKYIYFNGHGIGDDGLWEPEPSIFVLDILRDTSINLAKRFSQNAILWGEKTLAPELIWCS